MTIRDQGDRRGPAHCIFPKDRTLATVETQPTGLRDLFLLQPNVIFLNHGSFGACPRPVLEFYQRWQWEMERQPVEFLQRRSGELMRTARESLGAFVGAAADDLVYVTNVTTGLGLLLRWLPLNPGDEVLSTDHEYGSMENLWFHHCERSGTHYIRQALPLPFRSTEQVVEAIWSGVNERTRVLYLSHITSPTALIFPVEELVRRARERGILTVIDGAHAPGQIPLNLEQLGADFYLGNCHKWLMSPRGAGFLYARPEAQSLLWNGRVADAMPWRPRSLAGLGWQGTRDISAYLAVPAAIQFMEEHHWPQVQAECHRLACYVRREIAALTGLPPVTPEGPEWFAQMVICPLPPCDGGTLHRRLYDEFMIEVPITGYGEQRFARVSVQGYNTLEDMNALVEALKVLLPQLT